MSDYEGRAVVYVSEDDLFSSAFLTVIGQLKVNQPLILFFPNNWCSQYSVTDCRDCSNNAEGNSHHEGVITTASQIIVAQDTRRV